jgi:AraC family transcriptional regulator, transcriptional activator of pobA
MRRESIPTIHIPSIGRCHELMQYEKPKHPLFSIIRFEDLAQMRNDASVKLIFDYYQIVLKIDCPGKLQYGQTRYDFDEGVMSFFAPRQVNILEAGEVLARSGWLLNVHPDFVRNTSLAKKIATYGFWSYRVNEALILSDDEQQSIEQIFRQIEKEYRQPIDHFSSDIVIANIDLLLTYCNRYYERQFTLRKPHNDSFVERFEVMLYDYFEHEVEVSGLPSVKFFADKLAISSNYLSDLLRQITGQNAQQHIHAQLIEKAKERLTTTRLSVNEIAYGLGFEYPQSFSKLFKSKTQRSPVEFRRMFN